MANLGDIINEHKPSYPFLVKWVNGDIITVLEKDGSNIKIHDPDHGGADSWTSKGYGNDNLKFAGYPDKEK